MKRLQFLNGQTYSQIMDSFANVRQSIVEFILGNLIQKIEQNRLHQMSMRDQVCMCTLVSRVEISLDFLENVIQEVLQDAKELLRRVLFVGCLFKPFKSSRELEPQLTDRWRWQDIFGKTLLVVLFGEVILNF